jgi:uncharacterized protein
MVSRIITGALLLGLAIGLGGCGSSSTPTGQGVSQPDVPVQVHRRWGYIPTTGGAELRWTLFTPDEAGSYPILVEYDGYAAGSSV